MFKLFLRFELERKIHYFRTHTLAKVITSLLFLGVFSFVASGIYYFFTSGFFFVFLQVEKEIQGALLLFIYELFLIILSAIVIVSVMISGLFNLFRGETNNWLIASPSYKMYPLVVLIRSVMSSAFPMLVLFIPALLAYNKVQHYITPTAMSMTHLSLSSLFLIILSLFLLLLILNTLTLNVILLVGVAYNYLSKKIRGLQFSFGRLVACLLFVVILLSTMVWKEVRNIDIVHIFRADEITEQLSVSTIGDHFRLLPTHELAVLILDLQKNDTKDAVKRILILTVLAVLFSALWVRLSPRFYPLWLRFQEGVSSTTKENSSLLASPYKFMGGKTLTLFKKEALITTRNWKGLLWFLFLFLIWILQIGTSVILRHNIARHQPDLSLQIVTLETIQFIIAIYFISSFALRFVFPSFSVEKKNNWILGTAPLDFKKIFYGKYLFYTSVFVILGIIMSLANQAVLGLSVQTGSYVMMLLVSAIIFIVTLALSIGAIFPSTETDDPEAITTSMPGLFFTALALIYGALADGALYLMLKNGDTTPLLACIFLSIMLTAVILLATPSYFKKTL